MKVLSKEEIKDYVERQLLFEKVIEAIKKGNTYAVPGFPGEEVTSFSIDDDGNEYIEKTARVTLDEKTNRPSWIITKIDENNEAIYNRFGHINQYIVEDSVFRELYEPSNDGPNLYKKKKVEKFLIAREDIQFETEKGSMVVREGGYLKVTDTDRISAVSTEDFEHTYLVISDDIGENQITK